MKNFYFLFLLLFTSTAFAAVDVNNSFAPASMYPGEVSKLTIRLQNSILQPVTNVTLNTALPNGVFFVGTGNPTISNGIGFLNATNGPTAGSIFLAGAVIPPSDGINPGVLTLTFDVTAYSKGTYTYTIPAGAAIGTLNGNPETNPQASVGTLVTVVQGITVTATGVTTQGFETRPFVVTLTNPNPIALTNTSFSNANWGEVYVVSSTNTCGGTVAITPVTPTAAAYTNATSTTFTGGTIPANGSCTVTFNLAPSRSTNHPAIEAGTAFNLPIGAVTTTQGAINGAAASATPVAAVGANDGVFFNGSTSSTVTLNGASVNSTLELRFGNLNTQSVTGSTTASFPAGLTFNNVISNNCGGTFTAAGTTLQLNNITIPAAALNQGGTQWGSCTVSLSVSASAVGTYTVRLPPTGNATLGTNQLNATSATLTVSNPVTPPTPATPYLTMTTQWQGGTIRPGDQANLTYTITNPQPLGGPTASNIQFIQDVKLDMCGSGFDTCSRPFWKIVSFVSNTCGGTTTNTVGDTALTFSGIAALAPQQSCAITVRWQAANDTPWTNNPGYHQGASIRPGNFTYDVSGVGAQSNTAIIRTTNLGSVRISPGIGVSHSYSPTLLGPLGTTILTITIFHGTVDRFGIEDMFLRARLINGATVDNVPNIQNTCGGVVTAVPGSNVVTLNGGTLPEFSTGNVTFCTIKLAVKAPALAIGVTTATAGSQTLEDVFDESATTRDFNAERIGDKSFGNLEYVNNNSAAANFTIQGTSIQVNREFTPTTINGGGVSRMKITVTNTLTTAIPLTNISLTDSFAGTAIQLHPNPNFAWGDATTGLPTASCSGTPAFTGVGGTNTFTMTGASMAKNGVCAIFVNVTAPVGGNHPLTIPINAITTAEGITNDNQATATLTVGRQINVGKGFADTRIAVGDTTKLTITLFNTNPPGGDDTGANPALIDNIPVGLTAIAGTESTTCAGGIVTVGAGGQTVTLSGGLIRAGLTCNVTVNVKGNTAGTYTNTIPAGALRTLGNVTNPDVATANLVVLAKPTITKAFSTTNVAPGTVVTVTLTLANSNNATALPGGFTNVQFSDTLTDMVLAAPFNVGGTCTGVTYTGAAGDTTFTVTNGVIPPAGSCTITFPVKSDISGVRSNTTTGVLTGQTLTAGNASNTATYTVLTPPTAAKAFDKAEEVSNVGFTLTFTITNVNAIAVGITNAGLTDTFPTGMKVASPLVTTNTCTSVALRGLSGAALAANDTGIVFFGGSIPVGGCSISVKVLATSPGTYKNTFAEFQTNAGTSPGGDATIKISGVPEIVLSKACTEPVGCTTTTQRPGIDLTWQIDFTNSGGSSGTTLIIADQIPANTDFKVGSVNVNTKTTGLGFSIQYSNDGGTSWTYIPVSAGGGAAAGYDRNVTNVRAVFTGTLINVAPNNTGSFSFISQIR